MREVICADINEWIQSQTEFDSVITSLPDADETNMEVPEWMEWFRNMVTQIVDLTKNYAIFYQTDRKHKGVWISKAELVQTGAAMGGAQLRWHKIVLRRGEDSIDL